MALGLSTFRIHLDYEHRNSNFVIYSKDTYTQHCSLFLRHYEVKDDASLVALEDGVLPDNAADEFVKFSPKTFSLSPGQAQSVKFQMRRKANVEPNEYRAHLSVDCSFDIEELKLNNEAQVSLAPRIRHNVPIIVRTGKLDATVNFTDFKFNGDIVEMEIERQGNRSVYGNIDLVDSRSNKVIDKNQQFTMYPETQKRRIKMATKGIDPKYLMVRFIEDMEFEGNIKIEQAVK
tara:strand:- start:376 stop:1074 length:699 start_codon:yes stop_codon:yes gene_type:complete